MIRQYAACLYNQNLFICIVRMNEETNDSKRNKKAATKWEIIGNELVTVVGVDTALLRIFTTLHSIFFYMDSESPPRKKYKKQRKTQFTFMAFGFWCWFFFPSSLYLYYVCQFCLSLFIGFGYFFFSIFPLKNSFVNKMISLALTEWKFV